MDMEQVCFLDPIPFVAAFLLLAFPLTSTSYRAGTDPGNLNIMQEVFGRVRGNYSPIPSKVSQSGYKANLFGAAASVGGGLDWAINGYSKVHSDYESSITITRIIIFQM